MEYWIDKNLGEVCDIYQPKTISTKMLTLDGKYLVYGANGVLGRYTKYNHEESEILLTCRGATCGSVNVSEPFSWINGNAMVIHPKINGISKVFIYYWLKSINLSSTITGAAQPQITRQSLAPLKIKIPSPSEQENIVSILDKAFKKIDKLESNAERNLQNANALMASAMEKLLKPQKDWNEVDMSELCEIKSTLVDPTLPKYQAVCHIGGANIESETGKFIDVKKVSEEKLVSSKFFFDSSEILYNKIRPYLKKVARPNFQGLCSADMYPLSPKAEMVTRDFLYYILISKDFTQYAIENSARAGMPKLNRAALFAYKCYIPLINKQGDIGNKLNKLRSKCDELKSICQLTLSNCSALKQSILHQTFNGEL